MSHESKFLLKSLEKAKSLNKSFAFSFKKSNPSTAKPNAPAMNFFATSIGKKSGSPRSFLNAMVLFSGPKISG